MLYWERASEKRETGGSTHVISTAAVTPVATGHRTDKAR